MIGLPMPAPIRAVFRLGLMDFLYGLVGPCKLGSSCKNWDFLSVVP